VREFRGSRRAVAWRLLQVACHVLVIAATGWLAWHVGSLAVPPDRRLPVAVATAACPAMFLGLLTYVRIVEARAILRQRIAVANDRIEVTHGRGTTTLRPEDLRFHFVHRDPRGDPVLVLVTTEGAIQLIDAHEAEDIRAVLPHVPSIEELFEAESHRDGSVTWDGGLRRYWFGGLIGATLLLYGGGFVWAFHRMVEFGAPLQPFVWPTFAMLLALVVPGLYAFLRWPITRVREGVVVGQDFIVSLGLSPSVVWIPSLRSIERACSSGLSLVATSRNGSWTSLRWLDIEPVLRERAGLPRTFLYFDEALELLGAPRWRHALRLLCKPVHGRVARTYTLEDVEALRLR